MFDKFDYFNRGYIFGVKTDKYKPYINYDWSTTTAKEYKTDGVELVVNGGFDTDLSGWINTNSYWQWNNGRVYHPDGTVNNGLFQGNKAGLLTFDTEVISGSLAVEFNGVTTYYSKSGTYSIYSEAETVLNFKRHGSFHGYLDNISVQKVIQAPNKRYLKDVGSTPTYNASMYFGRGAYFNGVDQSIEHDAISSSDSVAYSFCGKQTFTSNRYNLWTTGYGISYYLVLNTEYKNISYAFNSNYNYVLNLTKNSIKLYENGLLVINITTTDILYGSSKTIGRRGSSYYGASYLKDFYIFDRNLTEIEITQAYEQPELFYAMAQADSACVLNMPMCETSSTARNYKTGIDYPISNYTTSVRDNAKNLQYGLQTCKFVRDSLGVIQSASDYLEADGVGYADTGLMLDASVLGKSFSFEIIDKVTKTLYEGDGIYNVCGWQSEQFKWLGNTAAKSISLGVFNHRVAIYNAENNTLQVFVNKVGGNIINCTLSTTTSASYPIGGIFFGGSILEVRSRLNPYRIFKVHNKVLTQAEITANFNSYIAKGLLS